MRDTRGLPRARSGRCGRARAVPRDSPGTGCGTTRTASGPTGWAPSTSEPISTRPTGTSSPSRARAGSGWLQEGPAWTTSSWPVTGPPAGSMPAPWKPPLDRVSSRRAPCCPAPEACPPAPELEVTGRRMAPRQRDTSSVRSSVRAPVCGLGGGPIRRDHQPQSLGDPRRHAPRRWPGSHRCRGWCRADARGRLRLSTARHRLMSDAVAPAPRPSSCRRSRGSTPRHRCGSTTARPRWSPPSHSMPPCSSPRGVQHPRRCGHVPSRGSGRVEPGCREVTVRVSVPRASPRALPRPPGRFGGARRRDHAAPRGGGPGRGSS